MEKGVKNETPQELVKESKDNIPKITPAVVEAVLKNLPSNSRNRIPWCGTAKTFFPDDEE